MSADHDMSSDYGYDLAHEVKSILEMPPARSGLGSATGAQLLRREVDPSADLGYDEAHDF
ncbi:hypothetical protein [Pseudonocardia nigra]|uniref:hypothetical protein n=1 Tax=Pseudonocardia nigra TaxID=1921578 RepID=UPI001C5CDC0D|nr:hypothetical protein [Pseudonocardia nigra]